MQALETLGPGELRKVIAGYRDALRAHQQPLNRLNVYPVPDGDTGTNMALTVESVLTELEDAGDDMASTCKAVSHGSLMGARGNSGVILSQILRGFTAVLADVPTADVRVTADALTQAAEAAYQAVMKPVEGTILTVVRESSAVGAERAAAGCTMLEVLEATRDEAEASLFRTPELLPALKEAGVVDAGGAGYVLLLDALLHVVDGRPLPEPVEGEGIVLEGALGVAASAERTGEGSSDLRYEVMYFLDAPDDTIAAFRDVWAGIGDSIVVVGGEGLWNCHIHTNDIGAAVEAALDVGVPRQIRVSDLQEQVEEERWVREGRGGFDFYDHAHEPVTCAVVAVATGDGVMGIFHSLGVQGIVPGGQSMNPSTAQLVEAVEAVPADEVVVLPNNKNIIAVAEQVDAETAKVVRVVPTRSIVEGFACLLSYDPEATAEQNAIDMEGEAFAVVSGEVCRAVRDSTCEIGPIHEGDHMGMGPGGILSVNADIGEAAVRLLDNLVNDEHEIVTVIEGDGATDAVTRHLTIWLSEHRPGIRVEVHKGGQPLYPYLFGIE